MSSIGWFLVGVAGWFFAGMLLQLAHFALDLATSRDSYAGQRAAINIISGVVLFALSLSFLVFAVALTQKLLELPLTLFMSRGAASVGIGLFIALIVVPSLQGVIDLTKGQ